MSHTRVFSSLFLPFESRRSTLIALGRRCYVLASIFLVERRQLPSMSSGFTLFVGTSRDFSSPANSAAVNALGFRRRSSKSHFIHGTTASVHPCLRPYIPISLLSAASSSYFLLPSTSFSISTSPRFMSLLTVFCVSPRFFSSFRSCFFPFSSHSRMFSCHSSSPFLSFLAKCHVRVHQRGSRFHLYSRISSKQT